MPDDKTLHELGNILAVIAGQAEFLLHQEPGHAADMHDSLTAIRDAALRGRDKLREVRSQPAVATESTARPAAAATPPLRVLLVDDNDDLREGLAGLLRQAGHRVEGAASGEEAIARIDRERFECVITDLVLPGLSGLTLSRVIKDRHPDSFVVLMTGSGEDFEPAMVQAAGVDRLLFKPSGRDELLAAVAASRRSMQAGA